MSGPAGMGGIAGIDVIAHAEGYRYVAALSEAVPDGDGVGRMPVSSLRLFEDGRELGPGRSIHAEIGAHGRGRFSHWGRSLFFSSSDNSDPRANGRRYQVVYRKPTEGDATALAQMAAELDFASLDVEGRYCWGERLFGAFNPGQHPGERSRSYFEDAAFRAAYERVEPDNHRSFDRKFALKELLKLALPLDGAVAECGVYRGASAWFLAQAIRQAGAAKRLHLFDSFEGVSEPSPALDGRHWLKGYLACDEAGVMVTLAEYADLVTLHPGWIPSRFGAVADERFCFVHLDVDLHQPTADALAFFLPRMVPGGLIVCDDYGFETCPGARMAMDEAAAGVGLPVVHLPTGQGFIVARARPDAAGGHDA